MIPLYDLNPAVRTPLVTYVVIALNVAVHLWQLSLSGDQQRVFLAKRAFVPARVEQLTNPDKVVIVTLPLERQHPLMPNRVVAVQLPADRDQILLSLLTMMFLHGGWMHLLGNMWFLWIFGNNIEDRLGSFGFTLFYLGSGLIAAACHYFTDPASAVPTIGASGAVSAVLGAYAIAFPHARIRTLIFLGFFVTLVDLPAILYLAIWFGGQLLEGLGMFQLGIDKGVAFWAHIGGFVAGVAVMLLIGSDRRSPDRQPDPDTDDRRLDWEF